MKILKALSALLAYPGAELVAALPEIKAVVAASAALRRQDRKGLDALIDHLAGGELFELQEGYGLLFDRTRALSLHLFEHVHGESRDRGQAMVDLIRVYEEGGYSPVTQELPDFLPLFLEFAATRPVREACDLIGQPAHVITALAERLAKRHSPYEAVFRALLVIAKARPDQEALAQLRQEADPEPDDLAALDAAWEEEQVLFGPDAGADCGVDSLRAKVRQARRPAPGLDHAAGGRPHPVIQHPGNRI